MYSVVFESDNGEKYVFGKAGDTMFDMDLGSGVPVNIGTSQGFSQIGETMQSRTVSGRTITVTGTVYRDVQNRKKSMRKIISPFSCGRLVFGGEYYTRVFVKNSPTFSTVKNDGRFSMQFFAPFPFFYSVNSQFSEIGSVKPMFVFPVNYATPHKFGERSASRYKDIFNDGDVKVPFSVYLKSEGTSTNIVISNLTTFKMLKINGTLQSGESINIYRDNDNVLRAELISDGAKSDVIHLIDESSDLFELEVGDNLISVNDDEGGASVTAKISFSPAVVALYES